MITKNQIKKLQTLKKVLSLSDDIYRDVLEMSFNVNSCTKLTSEQAGMLIDDFENSAIQLGLWNKPELKFENLSNRKSMATPKQLRMIEAMWREVSYREDDEFVKQSLRKFLSGHFYVSDLRFIDRAKASKIINAIKNIKKSCLKTS
ncbi:MAG TPA: regulatory protein GemA [Candidatus Gastranaerophilales bacterium]|nr:regulatory protein GemA [Candidatus Gastranaerophilales bacterium]